MRVLPVVFVIGFAAGACTKPIVAFRNADAQPAPDAVVGLDAVANDAGFEDAVTAPDAVVIDTGTPDLGFADAGIMDAAAMDATARSCQGDPFDPCTDRRAMDEPNDMWFDATDFHGSVGCVTSEQDYRTADATIESTICPNERSDLYEITVVPCDARSLQAEFRFIPRALCAEGEVQLVMYESGRKLDCTADADRIQCMRDGDEQIIRRTVAAGRNTIESWDFGVEGIGELKLDFDIRVRVF